jgi:hypothetical protein
MSESKEIEIITRELLDIECPILDVGDRKGTTGYIDFINTNEFSEPFNKGIDSFGRKFITFRANIEYEDGKITETFTTLFQRYAERENLWMGAGRHTHLFASDGGTTLRQIQLVLKLLQEGSVDISGEMADECRLTRSRILWRPVDQNKPKRIYIVSNDVKTDNSNEKPKENLEDVMRDLENKVNPKSLNEGVIKLVTAVQTNDPSILLNPMQLGAKEFEERVGRPMTYGEMRAMWG